MQPDGLLAVHQHRRVVLAQRQACAPALPHNVVKVGRTRCVTPSEFSVVNSSSKPVGSSAPAPTPSA